MISEEEHVFNHTHKIKSPHFREKPNSLDTIACGVMGGMVLDQLKSAKELTIEPRAGQACSCSVLDH